MEKFIPCRFHLEVGSVLKAEGMRTSKQRLDIWDELCSTDDHRDIETILQSLIKKKINVSRATLYRTIDVLVKHDLLKKVSLGNGKILYEHNKKSISPRHDHILCEDCGEIFEFFDSNITLLENKIAKKLNMKVTQRTHQLSGICNSKNCSHLTN